MTTSSLPSLKLHPPPPLQSEAARKAKFNQIRYAQCWEDTDVLLAALDIQPGDHCLSIASAGDNSLSLLAKNPARVVALDLNPAQLACLELRVAAFKELDHAGLVELVGSRPSSRRRELYARCRRALNRDARSFWDTHPDYIDDGIGTVGKFENYFRIFRERVLPLVHSRAKVERLLQGGTLEKREHFYESHWNTWRWNLMFRLFFSRTVMGRMGRDPSFFNYVDGPVSTRILARGRHALTQLNPAENPYLQWILTGHHPDTLPFYLRPENFDHIRNNLERLEWHCQSVEEYLDHHPADTFRRFNLSDIFEYISEDNFHQLLERIIHAGKPGARLAYWNTLADRHCPQSMTDRIRPLPALSHQLHQKDKTFFYCAFNVEELT